MRRLNLEVNKNMESMMVNDDYLFYKNTFVGNILADSNSF